MAVLLACAVFLGLGGEKLPAQGSAAATAESVEWKQVVMGIVKLNDEPPRSWNMYYSGKRGWVMLRLWKRYLLVGLRDEEVYDIDPQSFTVKGETLVWNNPEFPDNSLPIREWNERDIGPMHRIRFRLGKDGHILELQIPLKLNGRPMY